MALGLSQKVYHVPNGTKMDLPLLKGDPSVKMDLPTLPTTLVLLCVYTISKASCTFFYVAVHPLDKQCRKVQNFGSVSKGFELCFLRGY